MNHYKTKPEATKTHEEWVADYLAFVEVARVAAMIKRLNRERGKQ